MGEEVTTLPKANSVFVTSSNLRASSNPSIKNPESKRGGGEEYILTANGEYISRNGTVLRVASISQTKLAQSYPWIKQSNPKRELDVRRLVDELNLPAYIAEKAIKYLRRIKKRRISEEEKLALIYYACRELNLPVSYRIFLRRAKRKEFFRKTIKKTILKLGKLPTPDLNKYVSAIRRRLKLPVEVELEAIKILDELKARKIHYDKSPNVLAATCIYIASNLKGIRISAREISDKLNVNGCKVVGNCGLSDTWLQTIRKLPQFRDKQTIRYFWRARRGES